MGQSELGNSVKPVLIALILLAFGLGCWIFFDGVRLERIYQQETHERADNYAARARVAVEASCRPLPAVEELDCIRKENKTAREGAYNENDLKAQLVTSVWTKQMGIAAIVAMAFGVLGVGLVFVTFHSTREANAISREAMMAENRAWIEIVPTFQFGDLKYLETERVFQIKTVFTVKNIGETVARNVGVLIELIRDPSWFNETDDVQEFNERLLKQSTTFNVFPLFPEREATNDWTIQIDADKIRLPHDDIPGARESFFTAFCVGVRYNTIFDREDDPPHITTEIGSIRRLHEGKPSLAIVGRATVPSAEVGVMRVFRNLTRVT